MAALVSMNTMVPCLCTIHAHSVSGGTSHDAPPTQLGTHWMPRRPNVS